MLRELLQADDADGDRVGLGALAEGVGRGAGLEMSAS